MLSALPDDVAELVVGHNAQRIATYEGMSVDRVRALRTKARKAGYVAMDVVAVPGARTVSVAILTAAGRPVAALSVTAIALRMTPAREKELAKILQREASALGQLLDQREIGRAHV